MCSRRHTSCEGFIDGLGQAHNGRIQPEILESHQKDFISEIRFDCASGFDVDLICNQKADGVMEQFYVFSNLWTPEKFLIKLSTGFGRITHISVSMSYDREVLRA